MVVLADLTPLSFFNPKLTTAKPKNVVKMTKAEIIKMITADRLKTLKEDPLDYPIIHKK